MRVSSSIAAGTLAIALHSTAYSQSCAIYAKDVNRHLSVTVNWGFDPGNCTVTSAPVVGVAHAHAFEFYKRLNVHEEIVCMTGISEDGILVDVDACADGSDLLVFGAGCDAEASVDPYWGPFVRGIAQWSANLVPNTDTFAGTSIIISSQRHYQAGHVGPGTTYDGFDWRLGAGGGVTGHDVEWNFASACSPTLVVGVSIEADWSSEGQAYEYPSPVPPSTQITGVEYVQIVARRLDTGAIVGSATGTYARREDASVVRLGACANQAFDAVEDPQDHFTVDGTLNIPVTISSNTPGISLEVIQHSFGLFDGDMDGDGQVCWNDRILFYAAYGSSLGGPAYSPRGDFDIDGDIDVSDWVAYNSVACNGDFNCSGGAADEADLDAFFTAWGEGLPTADANGSGGTPDGADVDLFFEIWMSDCSNL